MEGNVTESLAQASHLMTQPPNIESDGDNLRIVLTTGEDIRAVPFEGVIDADDFGEIQGVEILGFREQIGVPPPVSTSEKAIRWSYDHEVDAFYVRFSENMSSRQTTKSGQALLSGDGSVVALEVQTK